MLYRYLSRIIFIFILLSDPIHYLCPLCPNPLSLDEKQFYHCGGKQSFLYSGTIWYIPIDLFRLICLGSIRLGYLTRTAQLFVWPLLKNCSAWSWRENIEIIQINKIASHAHKHKFHKYFKYVFIKSKVIFYFIGKC